MRYDSTGGDSLLSSGCGHEIRDSIYMTKSIAFRSTFYHSLMFLWKFNGGRTQLLAENPHNLNHIYRKMRSVLKNPILDKQFGDGS